MVPFVFAGSRLGYRVSSGNDPERTNHVRYLSTAHAKRQKVRLWLPLSIRRLSTPFVGITTG